jgi:hypothetical protein
MERPLDKEPGPSPVESPSMLFAGEQTAGGLQRAQSRLRIKPIAEFLMLSTGYECFRESFIHAFVDEEAFQGDTSLAAEHEHASKQVLGDCVRIRIRKNDAGVVPA